MKRLATATILVLAVSTGCESSPKPKKSNAPAATEKSGLQLDHDLLIQQVQLLRDREFQKPPAIEAMGDYDAPVDRCVDDCAAERELLVKVLFAGERPSSTTPMAHYDAEKNTVFRDASVTDAAQARPAVIAALVEGLDAQTLPSLPHAKHWDTHLAMNALRRGPGVFVAALAEASERSDAVDASTFARRPELLAELAPDRFIADFAHREGFALAAAMHRAGGWSAVELLRHEPPTSSMYVVRPDRYLDGTTAGSWTWPEETTKARTNAGWTQGRVGRVGPAVFVEWLSQHIDPRVARSAYLGWESDTYRLWKRGDDWVWEYLSLWNTPHVAQQIVEALDAGLRRQSPDGQYTVLRKGNTVAVIGSNQVLKQASLDLAAQLVDARPTFEPGTPRGPKFVPTPLDRLQSRDTDGISKAERWKDAATNIEVGLGTLGDEWTVMGTVSDAALPWFAKHSDGTILEYTTVVDDLFAPPFESKKRLAKVVGAFEQSVDVDGEVAVTRADAPAPDTIVLELTGVIRDGDGSPVQMKVWTFPVEDYVVAVSLQAPPEHFDAREKTATALVESLDVPKSGEEKRGKGIIEFRVE
jgi:hypothetical protein